jgi:hypothetical protein
MTMREDVKLEPRSAAFQNKVAASRNVSDEVPVNKPAPPPDAGITGMTPIASRRGSASDPASGIWPANRSSFTYYGKGPR